MSSSNIRITSTPGGVNTYQVPRSQETLHNIFNASAQGLCVNLNLDSMDIRLDETDKTPVQFSDTAKTEPKIVFKHLHKDGTPSYVDLEGYDVAIEAEDLTNYKVLDVGRPKELEVGQLEEPVQSRNCFVEFFAKIFRCVARAFLALCCCCKSKEKIENVPAPKPSDKNPPTTGTDPSTTSTPETPQTQPTASSLYISKMSKGRKRPIPGLLKALNSKAANNPATTPNTTSTLSSSSSSSSATLPLSSTPSAPKTATQPPQNLSSKQLASHTAEQTAEWLNNAENNW